MKSSDLNAEQLNAVLEKLVPMNSYLHALYKRLEANHLPPDDNLLRVAKKAADAVQELRMTVHYLECDASKKQ